MSERTLAYTDIGSGPPVLALHGAYSAGAEIHAFLDPVLPGHRRIYPDLPGHGDSATARVDSAAGAVAALLELLDHAVGDEPVLVVGHSFGAHLARGLAAQRPEQVRGLALICPMVPDDMHAEDAVIVEDDGSATTLPPEQADTFTGYFVVRTAATLARYRSAVLPVLDTWEDAAVERMMTNDALDMTQSYGHPVLIMTGRQDAWVGYRQHAGLLEAYPRATSLVLADAGHALPHERPEAFASALQLWLREATQR
ncbi:alpha/beta fold hydrolase [Pseudactinotalea sp.]|uniref:alpha/beta fold hydrolase n=1 Tax=Pseudactinotalea sp. TaxID=1926260 RepID=UPI003B3BAE13